MTRLLYRAGLATATHPWRTIAAWLAILIAALAVATAAGGTPHDDYNMPGTPAQRGTDLLRDRFPAMAGADARVVVHDPNGDRLDPAVLAAVAADLRRVADAGMVGQPRLSDDGDTAILTVQYTKPVTDLGGAAAVDKLRTATEPATDAGLRVELGGQVPENLNAPEGTAELIGLGAALLILLVAFGSVVAAGLPLVVALLGLGTGLAGVFTLAAATDVSTSAPTVASMVGLGVGIDYALLLITRHLEQLRRGMAVAEAAARATATAGQSILFAGATVLLSLLGLSFSGLAVYRSFGYATGLVVAVAVLAAVTLVPALCGLAGRRVLSRRERRRGPAARPVPLTARWAARVGRHPLPWAIGALAVVLTLAAPALVMRTWPADAGSEPTSNTVRRAYDLVAAEYGAGANGPLLVAVDLGRVHRDALAGLAGRLRAVPGVAAVTDPVLSPGADAAVLTVEPAYGPQDERAADLVRTLRDEVLPAGAEITGLTAIFVDVADLLAQRLWLVICLVVGLSLVLLLIVFRSVLVPVKAAVVNLLSIAAAYGVLVLVFQWGWAAGLVGLDHPVAVSTWVPMLLFTVLFGVSMDYEVFLLSRVREDWLATRDASGSVVRGLASTGRVITSAALIMVAVFAGFAADSGVVVKMIGVGMATAIAVDATVIRMVLVPATMSLMGRANWWLPRWLDRALPRVDPHGGEAVGGPTGAREPVAAAR